jgi:NTE family protein
MLRNPHVLVLGGGGVLGEAWMTGLLSGLEEAAALDMRSCEHFVGTSAGAIVAAHLAAGKSPRRPDEAPESSHALPPGWSSAVDDGARARTANSSPLASAACAPLVLGLTTRGGAVMRAALLRRLPKPRDTLDYLHAHVAQAGGDFDGRLRVTAVDRRTGQRVVFGSPGAPPTTVADAVTASCTVPWLFPPVKISGREYVDGAVWSPTNLDAAPAGAGTVVLCLNPTASLRGAGRAVDMFRRVSVSAATIETRALRRRGASVHVVAPDHGSADAIGVRLMDRDRAEAVLDAGYRQGLALARSSTTRPRGGRKDSRAATR